MCTDDKRFQVRQLSKVTVRSDCTNGVDTDLLPYEVFDDEIGCGATICVCHSRKVAEAITIALEFVRAAQMIDPINATEPDAKG